MTPDDRKYTQEHEWAVLEADGTVRIGISHYAQDQLGDIVFVELSAVGTKLQKAQKMGEIESVKAVSDLYAPLSGEVVEVNQQVVENPERVNEDPYEGGWLLRLRLDDPSEIEGLLSSKAYAEFLATQE